MPKDISSLSPMDVPFGPRLLLPGKARASWGRGRCAGPSGAPFVGPPIGDRARIQAGRRRAGAGLPGRRRGASVIGPRPGTWRLAFEMTAGRGWRPKGASSDLAAKYPSAFAFRMTTMADRLVRGGHR